MKTVDLFAGAGGFSTGAQQAGAEVVAIDYTWVLDWFNGHSRKQIRTIEGAKFMIYLAESYIEIGDANGYLPSSALDASAGLEEMVRVGAVKREWCEKTMDSRWRLYGFFRAMIRCYLGDGCHRTMRCCDHADAKRVDER